FPHIVLEEHPPTLLRTFPKRGYQFIAPVERIGDIDTPADPIVGARPNTTAAPVPALTRRHVFVLAATILSVLSVVDAYRWTAPGARSPVKVAVALFGNETRSAQLD